MKRRPKIHRVHLATYAGCRLHAGGAGSTHNACGSLSIRQAFTTREVTCHRCRKSDTFRARWACERRAAKLEEGGPS